MALSTNRRFKSWIPVLTLAMVFGLTTLGFAQQTVIQYAFWGTAQDFEIEMEIIRAFEAQHPDIKVEPVSGFNSGAARERMVTLHAAGMAPDLMRLDSFYFADIAAAGMLRPIDDLIASTPEFNLQDYFPVALMEIEFDGKLYGLPWGSYPRMLYYNRDLFAEAGLEYPRYDWTWDEYVEAARRLTRRDGEETLQWGTDVPTSATFNLSVVWGHGGRLLDDTRTTFMLHHPEAARGLQEAADLVNVHRVAPVSGTWTTLFAQGRSAMGTGFLPEVALFSSQNLAFDWDVHVEPAGPEGQFSLWKGNVVAISSQSENVEAAWKFLQFLLGPTSDGMKIYLTHKRIGPQTPDQEMWSIFSDPSRRPVSVANVIRYIATNTARILPVREGWVQFRPVVDQAWQRARRGEVSAQIAMQEIAATVQQILDETKL